jgi:hypothetical protein
MKRRTPRVGWIAVTAVAASALGCPSPRTRKPGVETSTGKQRTLDFSKATLLNPRDPKYGEVRVEHDGQSCYVELPFDEPPKSWQPKKHKAIDCAPSMDDPAWDACRTGSIYEDGADGSCVCVRDGNPPPPNVDTPCPK